MFKRRKDVLIFSALIIGAATALALLLWWPTRTDTDFIGPVKVAISLDSLGAVSNSGRDVLDIRLSNLGKATYPGCEIDVDCIPTRDRVAPTQQN